MANVGKNIKKIRTQKKMTQDELAEKLFVSRQTVSNYENNKSNPDIDTLKKIADVLGVDANTLIYGEKSFSEKKEIIEKYGPRMIVFLIVGIVIYVISVFISLYSIYGYGEWPIRAIPVNLLLPIWFLIFGWILMDIVCRTWNIQLFRGKYVSIFKNILWLLVMLYFILMIVLDVYIVVEYAKQAKEMSNSLNSTAIAISSDDPEYVMRMFMMTLYQFSYFGMKPYYFILPGVLLRAAKREITENIQ